MASHAATYKCDKNDYKGFKVLQIVFEDREKQIQRKHLGRIADVEAKDLSKPNFKEQVLKSINNFEDYELIKIISELFVSKWRKNRKSNKTIY